jgi:hypothetical protein
MKSTILAPGLLALPLLLAAPGALAQTETLTEPLPDPLATLSLSIENDSLVGADQYYTSGVQIAWRSASANLPGPLEWLNRQLAPFMGPGQLRWGLAAGQNIFTPADTLRRDPDPRDRPYAGYLYGAASLARDSGSSLTGFELQLGVVGPAALGEQAQNNLHRLINTDTYNGWDHQLKDEPVIAAIGQRLWRVPLTDVAGLQLEALPSVTLGLGTVQTYAGAGGVLRIGQGLEADYGPPRIRPALAGANFFQPRSDAFGWYIFAGAEGRAVARDIFLDGNTWRDSRSVDRIPWVGDFQAGFAVIWRGVRLSYTQVWRSKEFEGQPQAAQFGSVSVSFRF